MKVPWWSSLAMLVAGALVVGAGDIASSDDVFERIKRSWRVAHCVRFEFISVVESQVFDEIDSADGTAIIAADGRFNVKIGADHYIYDSRKLFSYSADANQVVVEQPPEGDEVASEVSFLIRLDDFYDTHPLDSPGLYDLTRKDSEREDIPGRLGVHVAGDRVARLRFRDVNGDPNTLHISKHECLDSCDGTAFLPAFPDSAEWIQL